MKLSKKTTSINVRRHGRRGFTLVELIVVLTIMAILAAIGVVSVIGYINRSRFDQNNQYAITVYQAAQTAITQKISNGSIQRWVLDIPDANIASDTDLAIPADAATNYSRNKTIALTYNPTSGNSDQGQYLHEFLMPYFYDQAVFGGTITVVFDISAVNNNGVTAYSASVISVYYSLQNTATEGWDEICRNEEDGFPNGALPDPDPDYRYTTSHVGYFNGTEESLRPNISPVFLPWSTTSDMEGHIIGPSDDPEASGYLFNLRNGETLDVSWAIFDEDGKQYEDHNEYLTIDFFDYETSVPTGNERITPSNVSNPLVSMTIDFTGDKTSPVTFNENTAQVTYEQCDTYTIKRETCYGLITVDVSINGVDSGEMTFPMAVTRVSGDGRTGTPRVPGSSPDERRWVSYFEYSISLDCMMERATASVTENRQYGVDRLFGDNPRNIFARISGSCSRYKIGEDGVNSVAASSSIPNTFAARAMNDPVYSTGAEVVNGYMGYGYSVVVDKGMYDGNDDTSNAAYIITGTGVVNTCFGDAVYRIDNTSGVKTKYGGTTWSDAGSNAVITSFRHLSNIRWFAEDSTQSGNINFRIVSNLDWYSHNTIKVNGVDTNIYASQVKVFSATDINGGFYTPVIQNKANSNGVLYTVSFPALPKIASYMTLSSISQYGGSTYSINNVQMRSQSFNDGNDNGYGLICENDGTVYNIYTNNLNIILSNVPNTNSYVNNDYASFNSGKITIDNSGSKPIVSRAIGGLVGYNLGSVGLGGEGIDIDETQNMIVMNNPVIICGQISGTTWKMGAYDWGTGAVIGLNGGTVNDDGVYTDKSANENSSTYGVFEVNGTFAIVAKKYVGGIIGRSFSDIGARLVINDPNVRVGTCEINLPGESTTNSNVSCLVAAMNEAGGAIGWIQDARFTYGATHQFNSTQVSSDPVTGVDFNITGLTDSDYGIDINLPANALVFEYKDSNNDTAVGGAIGKMISCSGAYLSIRVHNHGRVIITNANNNLYSGGVIGIDDNSTVSTLYIDVNNFANSRIGYRDDSTGSICTGGAIGVIKGNASGRTFAIRAENNGTIIGRGGAEGQGTGGVIGSTDIGFCANLYINVINGSDSKIICTTGSDSYSYGGTGGAIGGMYRNDSISQNSIIYVHNSGTIRSKHYVGGAIGTAPIINGKVYVVNLGSVRAADKTNADGFVVGGAVGYADGISSSGIVQSILNGANINGLDLIGGSIGRLSQFKNGACVRTIVKGSSWITGSGSVIGGVCGDIRIVEEGNSGRIELVGDIANPTLTIHGGSTSTGVGGVCGLMHANLINSVSVIMPNQEDDNRLIIDVQGGNDIGGAIGRLRTSSNNNASASDLLNKDPVNFDVCITINVVLQPGSRIVGSGNNVGGAIGYIHTKTGGGSTVKYFKGHIKISTVYVAGSSVQIAGSNSVGGAVGKIDNLNPYYSTSDSMLFVDCSLAPLNIIGSGNVGGVVGVITSADLPFNNDTHFPITAYLGTSIISASGSNIGGAVGYNNNSLVATDVVVEMNAGGSITGKANVGGAIGYNYCKNSNGLINSIETTINGTIIGTGTGTVLASFDEDDNKNDNVNVGGAIGISKARINTVVATVNGHIIGNGDAVGGAIGYIDADNSSYIITTVTAKIQGSGTVEGQDRVGGAVGFNISNLGTIESYISGIAENDYNAKVVGVNCVGGALGEASAQQNVRGSDVLNGSKYGRILKVIAHISADYALHGVRRMGGAVGQVGYKESSKYRSPALVYVEAEINAAYLFNAGDVDNIGNTSDACIGGVVGIFVDGRLGQTGGGVTGNVVLSGTGGIVHLDYPNRTYTNAFCISAYGCSIGGIIGEIGLNNFEQGVIVTNISADNAPNICVVSLNNSDRIGGWIGSSYARFGGIGSESTGNPATYKVNNVRAVVSRGGNAVGGFVGRIDTYDNNENANTAGTNAHIIVNLDGANIIGRSRVGGVFGEGYCCRFLNGSIQVTLSNRTNIGDLRGNSIPGDTTEYDYNCYEAGGAIGALIQADNGRRPWVNIPITVTIDSTSRVYAGYSVSGINYTDYGVGGAIGRSQGLFYNKASIRVVGTDPAGISVCSLSSNVGGAIGYIVDGNLQNASVGVSVRAEGSDACVGGVVGKIGDGCILNSHFGLDANNLANGYTITATGNNAYAGGFIGYVISTRNVTYTIQQGNNTYNYDFGSDIQNCYTTAEVLASGSYTGGFVGRIDSGIVKNCYVGGHTYQGQYVVPTTGHYDVGNIVGIGNVGGFVGATVGSNDITIQDCYSTASVTGSGANIGGFVGSRNDSTTIKTCYCTGLVTGSNTDSTGVFAGVSGSDNYSGNQVMNDINLGIVTRVVGSQEDSTEGISGIAYADMTGGDKRGHPFDPALRSSSTSTTGRFTMTTKINNEHWGDWPLPITDGRTIVNADVQFLETIDQPGDLNYPSYEYDPHGVTLENRLVLYIGSSEPVPMDALELTYQRNDRRGTATVTIAAKRGSGYIGVISRTFTIVQASINDATIVMLDPVEHEYTGAPISQDVEVTMPNGDVLVLNRDFYLEYNPPNHTDLCNEIHVTAHGTGNYQGTLYCETPFSIIGRNIARPEIVVTINILPEDLVYTGEPINPPVIVRDTEYGRDLVLGDDYTIAYENDGAGHYTAIDVGEHTITISGANHYGGSRIETYTITPARNEWEVDPAITGWTWGADPIIPSGSAKFGNVTFNIYSDATCSDDTLVATYTEGSSTDAYIEAMRAVDAGTYYMKAGVAPSDNYTNIETVTRTFTIDPAPLDGAHVEITPDSQYYDGTPRLPENVVVYFGEGESRVNVDSAYYDISYSADTINVGTVTVTVTGKVNYTGTSTGTYEIVEPPRYVTFHYNDGETPDARIEVPYDTPVAEPDKPSRGEAYRFDGWFTDPECSNLYDFNTSVKTSFDLYAGWTRIWTVRFETNGGTAISDQSIPNNGTLEPVADPIRVGYYFGGWYADSSYTNPFTAWDAPVTESFTIFAKWNPAPSSTVSFESDGGSDEPSQTVPYNGYATAPADPTWEGSGSYTFVGWFAPDGSEFDFVNTRITTDIVLTAHWEEE